MIVSVSYLCRAGDLGGNRSIQIHPTHFPSSEEQICFPQFFLELLQLCPGGLVCDATIPPCKKPMASQSGQGRRRFGYGYRCPNSVLHIHIYCVLIITYKVDTEISTLPRDKGRLC